MRNDNFLATIIDKHTNHDSILKEPYLTQISKEKKGPLFTLVNRINLKLVFNLAEHLSLLL